MYNVYEQTCIGGVFVNLNKVKLALAMARQGLNLTRLAALSDVSRATLSYANNGKSISPEIAGKIARALGVDVSEIITGAE